MTAQQAARGSRARYTMLAVIAAVAAGPALAVAARPVVAQVEPDREADALAGTLRTELASLPATTATADYEASIVFALSQNDYSFRTITEALNQLTAYAAANGSADLRTAIYNVRIALLSRRLRRGTAAIDGGYGGGFSGSSFSTPIISIGGGGGGGGSNYSQ